MSDLQQWVGRISRQRDVASPPVIERLAAVLDHEGSHWPSRRLPPLGHWVFHLPRARQADLGADGHPKRGGYLPPIEQPRRMWAGSRVRFLRPIELGAEMEKTSTILSIAVKNGAAGEMVFVTVVHELSVAGEAAIAEEQDLVYLDIAPPGEPREVKCPDPEWAAEITADPTLLFRFSALTFNSHRIHYDTDYAREIEQYPALVVHGPLQAMLLLDRALKVRPDGQLAGFEFRARSPLYAGEPFTLCGTGHDLWTRDVRGNVTMTARAAWA